MTDDMQNGKLLSEFVWTFHLLEFETLILALCDRDNNPNALALLRYLLLVDNQFSSRVDRFVQLHPNKEWWVEDNWFAKYKQYMDIYPEPHGE
jgi:hypothetical protein